MVGGGGMGTFVDAYCYISSAVLLNVEFLHSLVKVMENRTHDHMLTNNGFC